MNKGLYLAAALSLLTSSAFASETSVSENQISGVRNIVEKNDNSYRVRCVSGSKGTISMEENNICVFSKSNDKNRCDDQDNWSIEDAAEYICQ